MKDTTHSIGITRNDAGFAMLAIMGLLVALTIAITILLPNGITSHDIQNTDTERQNLHSIGQGAKRICKRIGHGPQPSPPTTPAMHPLPQPSFHKMIGSFPAIISRTPIRVRLAMALD